MILSLPTVLFWPVLLLNKFIGKNILCSLKVLGFWLQVEMVRINGVYFWGFFYVKRVRYIMKDLFLLLFSPAGSPGCKGRRLYGRQEPNFLPFLIALMQLIDYLNKSGLQLLHIILGQTFLLLLQPQQYLILYPNHLIAPWIHLNLICHLIFGLHCHYPLKLILNDDLRVLCYYENYHAWLLQWHWTGFLFCQVSILAEIFQLVCDELDGLLALLGLFLLQDWLLLALLHFL